MDYESLNQYVGKSVKLTLNNGWWYKAKITTVSENTTTFIELKGRTVSVENVAVQLIEEVYNGYNG
jgi:hypothetical protein